jgi:hypothetical protein
LVQAVYLAGAELEYEWILPFYSITDSGIFSSTSSIYKFPIKHFPGFVVGILFSLVIPKLGIVPSLLGFRQGAEAFIGSPISRLAV